MDLRDLTGRAAGSLLAPFAGLVALVRRARTFHPEGAVFHATVEPLAEGGALGRLARRLQGKAIVRLSSAWWRGGKEWPDVLGVAVRFNGDQDLLAATVRSPWTTLLAPLTTLTHDFLANDYYAVSPFVLEGLGRAKLRLRSLRHERHAPDPGDEGLDRAARLVRAVADGRAILRLEARALPQTNGLVAWVRSALAGTALDGGGKWVPIADIRLRARAIEQKSLRFSPFHSGRGIKPTGFVHALRAATYAMSQAVRLGKR